MICGNCGKEVPEGRKFCTTCGWKVPVEEPKAEEAVLEEPKAEETVPEEPKAEEAVPEAPKAEEVIPEEPKVIGPIPEEPVKREKKKGGRKAPIFIALAAVVAVAIALVLNWPAINNAVKRTVLSPEEYYQWVEKQTAESAAASMAGIYNAYLQQAAQKGSPGVAAEITLEIGEAGKDMLSLAGLSGVDLSWFESVTLSSESYVENNMVQSLIGLALGKEKLLSLDFIADTEEQVAYIAFPELSKNYVGAELDVGYYLNNNVIDADAMQIAEKMADKLPAERDMEELLARYMEKALENVDEVKLRKEKTLKAEGISQKCTQLEVTIDAATLTAMLEAVLEEMEEDEELAQIILDICAGLEELDLPELEGLDSEEVVESFQDSCRQARQELEYVIDSDTEIIMTVYVDRNGNIRGRVLEYSDYWDAVTFELVTPHKGNEFGFKASVSEAGEEVAFTGSGKDSGGKVSGEFFIEYNGTKMLDIGVKGLDMDKLEQGLPNGSFTVSLATGISRMMGISTTSSMLSDMQLAVDISTSENSAKCSLVLDENGDRWGSIAVSVAKKDGKKISAPGEGAAIFVEDEYDFEEYWDSIDWDGFLDRLEKTELPSEVTDVVEILADMDASEALDELSYLMWDMMYYY